MFIFAGDSRGKNTNLIRKKNASDFGEFTQGAGIFQQLGQFRCCRRLKVPGFVDGGILPLQSWENFLGAKFYG